MRPTIYNPKHTPKVESEVTLDDSVIEQVSSMEWSDDEEVKDPPHPLTRLKKHDLLSVTDFSSQIWCEEQIILKGIHGRAPETKAMLEGTQRHEVLELEDHDIEEVFITSREEGLAFRLLNSIHLIEKVIFTGITRELWVLGYLERPQVGTLGHNYRKGSVFYTGVRGIIDDLSLRQSPSSIPSNWDLLETPLSRWQWLWEEHGTTLLLGDTKTRRVEEEPPQAQKQTSAIQLQTYHYLVNTLRSGNFTVEDLLLVYDADGDVTITHEGLGRYSGTTLSEIMWDFLRAFQRLPPLEDFAEVIYDCNGKVFARNNVPCPDDLVKGQLEYLIDFWTGMRDTSDIPLTSERWKCKWCYYLPYCNKTPLKPNEVEDALKERELRLERDRLEVEALKTGGETPQLDVPKFPQGLTPEPTVDCVPPSQRGCKMTNIIQRRVSLSGNRSATPASHPYWTPNS